MKRKKINIKEADLLSPTEQSLIIGGKRTRIRAADGSKMKIVTPEADAEDSENEE